MLVFNPELPLNVNYTGRYILKDTIFKELLLFHLLIPSGKINSIRIRKILQIIYEFAPNSGCEFFRNSEKELNPNSLRIRYAN